MKIEFNGQTKIGAFKNAFNEHYQYLKLAFFSKAHDAFELNASEFMIHDDNLCLKDISKLVDKNCNILVNEFVTVKDLESKAESEFGLYIQVLRKSRNAWLATTVTDTLTLKAQNEKGKESTIELNEDEILDYREQD